MNRRNFLRLLALAGASGGATALHQTVQALGLTAESSFDGPLRLQGQGDRRRIVILGAGLAGLTAAYELGKLDYECIVLEARDRAGGRCWTARRGDELTEAGGERQVCAFDEGQFFNAGPDRIPQHHRAVLAYCREFNIPMRAFVTLNTACYHYHENVGLLSNRKTRISEVWANLNGYTMALLASAIQAGALDDDLRGADKQQMLDFLKSYGNLSDQYAFDEAGWAGTDPNAGAFLQAPKPLMPLDLSAVLQSEYWRHFPIDWDYNLQLALLHPEGGMDQIPLAFEQRIGQAIRYGAEVREIRRTAEGVRVVYRDTASNQKREVAGDYCICTVPLPVLANIPNDFPAEVQRAIRGIPYLPGMTMGMQFSRRFWEDDDFIYGGGTFTNLNIGQIWYPSRGYHAAKGVLRGVHAFGEPAAALGERTASARAEEALTQGAKIHPQYRNAFESAFSVAWHKVPYSLGAWALYTEDARENVYPRLLAFDDRIHLAGDHMSHLAGWMEGAVLSAQGVTKTIHEQVQRQR